MPACLRARRTFVGILACGLALAGCRAGAPREPPREGPSLTVAGEDFDREPETLSSASALQDLDEAFYLFDEAYAGVDGASRTPSRESLAEARAQLASRSAVTPRAFVGLLRKLFWQPDGHLAFGYGGRTPVHLLAKPLGGALVSDAFIERVDAAGIAWVPRGRLLGCAPEGDAAPFAGRIAAIVPTSDGRFLLAPSGQHDGDTLACRVEREGPSFDRLLVPLRPSSPFAQGPDGAAVELTAGDVPVLTLRTFDNADVEALRELPRLGRRLRESPGFVVDLRGNGGGNYGFAEPFLLELTSAELRRLDEREVVSVAAAEGRANAVRRRIATGEVPAGARAHFDEELSALEGQARELRAAGAPRSEVLARNRRVRGRAPHPLSGRAVFLVDAGCASACEMMLAMARQIPGVIVVGQSTRGGMAVGELALFQLRRSGVAISFGTRAFSDPLGDFQEERGFLPDLWIGGGDPVAIAKDVARGALGPPRLVAQAALAPSENAPTAAERARSARANPR